MKQTSEWGLCFKETSGASGSPVSIRSTGSGSKHYEDIVASSSALILHNRPSNLPAKSQDEEQKHRQEYRQMVEAARKKGVLFSFMLPEADAVCLVTG
jgi:hypothetical protein